MRTTEKPFAVPAILRRRSALRKIENPMAVPALSLGAAALGALALGALAIGALAIGRLAIRRVTARRARFDQVEIGTLTIHRLKLVERSVPES
jgi:hypothetical protein